MLNAVIDLSHYNTIQSFQRVKAAGILGVIHKATHGTGYVDPTFAKNRKEIGDAGLLFGAYHFGVAGDAAAQAEHLVQTVGADPGALLVLDYEDNPKGQTMSFEEAELFVHRVFELTGRYPGLYSGHTVKEALAARKITDPAKTELSKCWLWIAQYASKPVIPKLWPHWTLWQYTDGAVGPAPHQVDGIDRCDRDQFIGDDAAALSAFWASGKA